MLIGIRKTNLTGECKYLVKFRILQCCHSSGQMTYKSSIKVKRQVVKITIITIVDYWIHKVKDVTCNIKNTKCVWGWVKM